jgi:hydroxylamine reductase (hybrid-cluster protein)
VAKVLGLTAVTYGVAWIVVTAFGTFSLAPLVAAYLVATAAFALGARVMIGSDLKETLSQTLHRVRGSEHPPGELAKP